MPALPEGWCRGARLRAYGERAQPGGRARSPAVPADGAGGPNMVTVCQWAAAKAATAYKHSTKMVPRSRE